jgi:hypothetical protein
MLANTCIPSSYQEHFQGEETFYSFGVSGSGFGDDKDVEPYQLLNFLLGLICAEYGDIALC